MTVVKKAAFLFFVPLLVASPFSRAASEEVRMSEMEGSAAAQAFSRWEFGGAVAGLIPGLTPLALRAAHIPVHYFITDRLTAGLEARYWSKDYNPVSQDAGWAFGPSGQFYLFRTRSWGGYLGGLFCGSQRARECFSVPKGA